MEKFDAPQVRRFLVARHGLGERTSLDRFCDDLPETLGSLQFDPLNIVGRNVDLALQARVNGYRAGDLDGKMYGERVLVDGWDKMMSVFHVSDWPRFARVRAAKDGEYRRMLEWRGATEALDHVGLVLRELADRGPLSPRDLELGKAHSGRWGHKNVSSVVLDYLFMTGAVGVKSKSRNRKTYDLIERLVPESVFRRADPFETDRDFHKWLVLRRVSSVGVLWNRKGVLWQGLGSVIYDDAYRESLFSELTGEGLLREVAVGGIDRKLYVTARDLPALRAAEPGGGGGSGGSAGRAGAVPTPVRLLAPLDNLLWERELVSKLFGFDYTWEVYLPKEKRKYGYYVLPVLYGSDLVARVEPRADRERKTLRVENLWLEPGMAEAAPAVRGAFGEALEAELARFAEYLSLDGVELGRGAEG